MWYFCQLVIILNLVLSVLAGRFSVSGSFSVGGGFSGGGGDESCFVKDMEDNVCSKANGDHCKCHDLPNCEYNSELDACVPFTPCQKRISSCPSTKLAYLCRRPGAYYAHGGVLCKNEASSGNCNGITAVIGILTVMPGNIPIEDSRGIVYLPHRPYLDPNKIRAEVTSNILREKNCKAYLPRWTDEQRKDDELYLGAIYGAGAGGCISFIIPEIEGVGHYEISLKFVEWVVNNNPKKRIAVIKLGDMTILNQVDVAKYVGLCMPMEIIVPFEVTDEGSTIIVQGFPPIPNDEQHAGKLSVCFGDCPAANTYLNFVFSSFYMARLPE